MKSPPRFLVALSLLLPAILAMPASSFGENTTDKKVEMEIGINREHRDVGLKRMELLDRMLSSELMEKKRNLVREVEQDYNGKITELINSILPPVAQNKVLTHIDVNFFSPEFETEVYSSQKIGVSLILRYGAFRKWASQYNSEQAATNELKGLIHTTFKIPTENIAVTVVK